MSLQEHECKPRSHSLHKIHLKVWSSTTSKKKITEHLKKNPGAHLSNTELVEFLYSTSNASSLHSCISDKNFYTVKVILKVIKIVVVNLKNIFGKYMSGTSKV